MLNFLCADIDQFDGIITFIGVIVSIIIIVIGIVKRKVDNTSNSSAGNNSYPFSNHPNSTGQLTPEQGRYQSTLKQRQSTQKPTTTTPPEGGHGHAHVGTVESYDPIVGSLGDVSDEGCDELANVRLIVTDLMYETADHETAYDLSAIRKSVILGEVLNNPRFKHPYGKK